MAPDRVLATRAQKGFILTIAIQAIAVLVLIAVVFRLVDEQVSLRSQRFRTLPCYLALFALGELFELFMAFDALRLRNVIQLIGILIFHIALGLFALLQIHQMRTALVIRDNCTDYVDCGGPGTLWQTVKPLLIVAPSVIAGSWLLMIFFVKKLYEEFGWAIFHIVGANPKMKTMYRWYQILVCLLKFDFFFFTGVTMQLLILVLQTSSVEFGITIAAIPVVLILLICCGLAVQREIKVIMAISLVLMVAASSYFYKLIRFYQPENEHVYISTRATLTVFTIIAFILLILSFIVGIRCLADFDQGLLSSKVNSIPRRPGNNGTSTSALNEKPGETIPLGPRISIE